MVRCFLILVGLGCLGCGNQPKQEPPKPSAKRFQPKTLKEEPRYKGIPLSTWAKDLQDKDIATRNRAADIMAAIGEPSLAYFAKAMQSDDSDLRATVGASLIGMNKIALPLLFDLLDDAKSGTRFQAATSLSFIYKHNPGLIPADSPEKVRAVAVLNEALTNEQLRPRAEACLKNFGN